MICALIDGWQLFDGTLRCAADPLPSNLASGFAAAAAVLSVIWAVFRARGHGARLGTLLAAFSFLLLGGAAGMPVFEANPEQSIGGRHVVVLDASESVRREGDGALNTAILTLAQKIGAATLSADVAPEDWSGYVIRFSNGAETIAGPVRLKALAPAVQDADLGPPGSTTNLSAGLNRALDIINKGSGVGAIWLLSDGWATGAEPGGAVRRAVAAGIPIHVLPITVGRAVHGLTAANLGPEQGIGQEAVARLTAVGGGTLDWRVNGKAAAPVNVLDRPMAQSVRLPVVFTERGINHVALSYKSRAGPQREKTLFSLVRGPARVLVYGRADWLAGLPRNRFVITRADAKDPVELAQYDAVVVDGLKPSAFASDFPERLLARGLGGAGLLLVNGQRIGTALDEQNISLWEDTVLGPVLPVSGDPQAFQRAPPKRDILIVMDTSGSMGAGSRMADAKRIAYHIIRQTRPVDSLAIIPFSDEAGARFRSSGLTASERTRAESFVSALAVGGGTDVDRALRAASSLRGNYCALFVIGDGDAYADRLQTSPLCRTNAIGVAGVKLAGFDKEWGESIALPPGGSIGNLTFEYFKPKPLDHFWRAGPLGLVSGTEGNLFENQAPVSGVARSYPRPEAQVWAVTRQPPRNPVLAYRDDPQRPRLTAGVFLGQVPAAWAQVPNGRQLIERMISRIVGWKNPDRYAIEVTQNGRLFDLRISILDAAQPPASLSASMLWPDGRSTGFAMQRGREPGVFHGAAQVRLAENPARAMLSIDEGGGQLEFIPIVLPGLRDLGANNTTASTSEAESIGTNEALLGKILKSTRGLDLSLVTPELNMNSQARLKTEVWVYMVAIASIVFAGSLFFGGMRR